MAMNESYLKNRSIISISIFEGGPCIPAALLGFPFYVKKLFTRNIVTDVTDGYYVVITVVTT
jgi:hypothetical protein